ncbi:hypothetical protein KAFR_0C03850 [Kazachstania africana CBS 2517]|uniref:Protein farnesyltransferase/geranylgeranyltransferase type-1 subunit alpha n=1 Tax=Kazachstania africana (strain ATCC 22294 / BCRC 22015 / CBS 2517 / CECT 1963 / NBRC 1671 / NRRL Y-8276) TaxID=1071382 RepID=H2ASM6_KAZAF|nr:hypothetical protein KAFR_0C03850 [Kazachstania africana CBS 2517]CCF57376.1 hypothetical protein KAFR_0C03850 [Kazachstania africana CBS 2517]
MSDFNVEDYSDVTLSPLTSDVENELCKIMYTEEYKQLMGIAFTLMKQDEFSDRAFQLTSKIIDIAPAFYTIWNYRYKILDDKVTSCRENDDARINLLNDELDWLDEVTLNNPKNYQIWSYRQSLLTNLHPSPSIKRELPILQLMIDDDSKNYHVWSYRKWCIIFFKITDFNKELEYTNSLIDSDIYNNSAWNHRMFIFKSINQSEKLDQSIINGEVDYIKGKIETVPQNISPWNYLRGFLHNFCHETTAVSDLIPFAEKFVNIEEIQNQQLPDIESSYALEFLAEAFSLDDSTKQRAVECYKGLATKYDPIRENLWNHKIELLK